jgi:hypothetical protein
MQLTLDKLKNTRDFASKTQEEPAVATYRQRNIKRQVKVHQPKDTLAGCGSSK